MNWLKINTLLKDFKGISVYRVAWPIYNGTIHTDIVENFLIENRK